jgi:hypothetical protein
VQNEDLREMAYRTAVGACSLATQNRWYDMQTLVGLFLNEADEQKVTHEEAMVILLHATIGLTLHVAKKHVGDATEYFDSLAVQMAQRP